VQQIPAGVVEATGNASAVADAIVLMLLLSGSMARFTSATQVWFPEASFVRENFGEWLSESEFQPRVFVSPAAPTKSLLP
jgi:hypothetical protein